MRSAVRRATSSTSAGLGAGKRLEPECAALGVTHVHAVEREDMRVDIESQGRVRPLHGAHGAGVRVLDAREAELLLGPLLERTGKHGFKGEPNEVSGKRARQPLDAIRREQRCSARS
jgi:hypothetical protein